MTDQVAQYFGVAATTTRAEVEALCSVIDRMDWPSGIQFMNGPLVSHKTLTGLEPSNPRQYPVLDWVGELLIPHNNLFNVLHFNSRDPKLAEQLIRMVEISNDLHGIQLNIRWPDKLELRDFRFEYPHVKIILQVGEEAFAAVGRDSQRLLQILEGYEPFVDYVLFDQSGGLGKPFDQEFCQALLQKMVESGLRMTWGITGGLSASNTDRLKPLLEIYPRLCWDAQSRLRDAADNLDIAKCSAFIEASAALLR